MVYQHHWRCTHSAIAIVVFPDQGILGQGSPGSRCFVFLDQGVSRSILISIEMQYLYLVHPGCYGRISFCTAFRVALKLCSVAIRDFPLMISQVGLNIYHWELERERKKESQKNNKQFYKHPEGKIIKNILQRPTR